MGKVKVQVRDDKLIIGESPELIVDLKDGSSYIQVHNQKIPYMKKIRLSEDILNGKRKNVFETAVSYYYDQACKVAEGYGAMAAYWENADVCRKEVER